jgi:putative transposase
MRRGMTPASQRWCLKCSVDRKGQTLAAFLLRKETRLFVYYFMALRGRNSLVEERYFFVTTTVVRFLKIFTSRDTCDILVNNIKYYCTKYHFTILSYIIMPSHFHWIVEINPEYGTISDIMRDLKRNSSKELIEYFNNDKYLQEIFIKEARGNPKQNKKFWMSQFDDEVIRNQKMFWDKLNYIHKNPVEVGLVSRPEDYKYSSARNYIFDDHSVLEVDTKQGGIIFV